MLSILIPTHNTDCLRLVADLHQQGEELQAQFGESQFRFEILLIDDASTDKQALSRNELAEAFDHVRYIQHTANEGRVATRNHLLRLATYPYLLMVDADAEVCQSDFLLNYWTRRDEAQVLVGGLTTPTQMQPGCELRHRYETAAASKRSLQQRLDHPYEQFTAFNLFAETSLVQQIGFDPRCAEYGHEDTLLGIELQNRGCRILHIDNPLVHTGINSNESFLANTEAALRNLARIGSPLTDHSPLAQLYARLSQWQLAPLLCLAHTLLAPILKRQLRSSRPSLRLFKLYKLLYFAHIGQNPSNPR
ncbi:MAG: glycosyltransferase family 2 protein [Bacteroidaceae bacterium]|nr:glycosyltransferase family 2 protein [Bacteroidaceae bacterium]